MKHSKISKAIIFTLVFLLLNIPARAHDYWLEPENFFPAENELVTVHMQLGTKLVVEEERPYQLKRTVFFKLFSAINVVDLLGASKDGAMPVATFRAGSAGTYLLAKQRNPTGIVLDAEKFNEYLHDEGLTDALAERIKRGENKKFGYERYSRFLKSLIQVGNHRDSTYKRLLGFKLEIQPLENPYSKKTGDSLKLRVLFDGRPLANSAVFAYNRLQKQIFIQNLQTGKDGSFSVRLDRKGFWLLRLVDMRRCQKDCEETDWESFWSSLSFEIR